MKKYICFICDKCGEVMSELEALNPVYLCSFGEEFSNRDLKMKPLKDSEDNILCPKQIITGNGSIKVNICEGILRLAKVIEAK